MYQNNLFLYFLKLADLEWKNADASRNEEVRHVIQISFKSPLGKV